jgi:hypothetical protein
MLQEEQEIWLRNNANKVREFENFMMTLTDLPPSPLSNLAQVIDPLFYEWEFLSKYAMMFNPGISSGSYSTLIENWMWDMLDSWQSNKDQTFSFTDSFLWKQQREKNNQALQQALLIPTLGTKKERAQFLGLSGVAQDISSVLGGAMKFIPVILIGIVFFYGIRTFKR